MRGDPYSQAEEMFLRMVFNVVIRNQDDHLSLWIRPANGLCLQPMISASPTTRKVHVTDTHQMSINGKFDDLTREDLLACAAANNIKNAVEMYKDETFSQCKKRWRSFLMREYLQLANILKTCLRVVRLAGST